MALPNMARMTAMLGGNDIDEEGELQPLPSTAFLRKLILDSGLLSD